jgi:hypothetical protein
MTIGKQINHHPMINHETMKMSNPPFPPFSKGGRGGIWKIFFYAIPVSIGYLLSAIGLFMIVGCQQVQKPEVKGEGPLAVKMARGITSPEFHAPLERWRTTHKKALSIGDFSERECILCHDPKKSCNNCHKYIGARAIDVPEVSLFWPEEKKEKE